MGEINISMPVMNEAKLPTVTAWLPPLGVLCHSATVITPDKASAASIWISGVMVELATTDFKAS